MEKRAKIAIANWKMNGDKQLLQQFANIFNQSIFANQVVFALPSVFLADDLAKSLPNLAGQDVSCYQNGAYTGEISAQMLKEAGCQYCIVGHSERRKNHHENEIILLEKIKRLKEKGIIPIYCVGESLEDYEQNQTQKVLNKQLLPLMEQNLIDQSIIIAYEPVWAIGTGKPATAEYAQKIHQIIRELILVNCGSIANQIKIIYGGSVKSENAQNLANYADIDGFLVGGAGLDWIEFRKIAEVCL